MYVLVKDRASSRIIKVSAIGPMVSFSQPQAELDELSNLHVLYQSGAKSFLYSVVSPAGVITEQEIYDYFGSRPRLAMDDKGNIIVKGGERRVRQEDVPTIISPDELQTTGQ
ncbi:MAG TPA: hypothetical protein VFY06_03745, partial [Verrucomicrobiae bacterium]|nr:hypothetical protein [Verrucomicrobiae bacterium]